TRATQPVMVACKTHIGFGAPTKQDTAKAHGSPLGAEEIAKVREIYGWSLPPFEVPADVAKEWKAIGARGKADREAWEARLKEAPGARQAEFARVMAGEPPKRLAATIRALKKQATESKPK